MAGVKIEIGNEDSEELRDLAGWLRGEDDLRGRVDLASRPVRPDEMGAELEAVVILVTSGTAAALTRSLLGWLNRRTDARRVSLKIRPSKGGEVTLQCGSADEAQAVLAEVRKVLDSEA